MTAIAIPLETGLKPAKPRWEPKATIGPKKLPVDRLAEARALSGIPIHTLQEFIEFNSLTTRIPDVRKLALEGRYQEIVFCVTAALRLMYRSNDDLGNRIRFFNIHLGKEIGIDEALEIEEQIVLDSYREVLQHPSLRRAIEVCSQKMVQIIKEMDEGTFRIQPSNEDILEELQSLDCSELYLKPV